MRQLTIHDALDESARCEQCKGWLYNACGGVDGVCGFICNHCMKIWPETVMVRGRPVAVYSGRIVR